MCIFLTNSDSIMIIYLFFLCDNNWLHMNIYQQYLLYSLFIFAG